MKKRNIFIGIICFFMLFILTGCGNKVVITTNDFKAKAESLSYATYDATSQYSAYEYVKEATIAQSSDGYQVEFYVLDNIDNAISMFNTNKETFKSYKSNSSAESTLSSGNYSNYNLTSSGYYLYLCRVDNTLLYVKVNSAYKDKVKVLIEELGY